MTFDTICLQNYIIGIAFYLGDAVDVTDVVLILY